MSFDVLFGSLNECINCAVFLWICAEWLNKTGELISESCLLELLLWGLHYGLTTCRQGFLLDFASMVT